MNIIISDGTEERPYYSSQIILLDENGGLFFHKNPSISSSDSKLTLVGGQVEKGKSPFQEIMREIKEETALHLSLINIEVVGIDAPKKFDKGWFQAFIFKSILSAKNSKRILKKRDIKYFSSLENFEKDGRNYMWGTNFEHVKGLVHKAIIGK